MKVGRAEMIGSSKTEKTMDHAAPDQAMLAFAKLEGCKSLTDNLYGSPVEIFNHHKCATTFLARFLKEFCDTNNLKHKINYRGVVDMDEMRKGMDIVSLSNADYRFVKANGGSGLHVIRNPLAIVNSAYFSHRNVHPSNGWHLLEEQRDSLLKMNKEDGIWSTIEFLEREEFYPETKGPLRALREWDFDDEHFFTLRCEDLVKSPARCLIDAIATHYKVTEDLTSAFSLPPEKNFTFAAMAEGRKPGEVDNSHHFRSGNPQDYMNNLTNE